jgi:hypothetical protein
MKIQMTHETLETKGIVCSATEENRAVPGGVRRPLTIKSVPNNTKMVRDIRGKC